MSSRLCRTRSLSLAVTLIATILFAGAPASLAQSAYYAGVTLHLDSAFPSGDQTGSVAVDSKGDVLFVDVLAASIDEIVAGTGGAAPGTVNANSTAITLISAGDSTLLRGIGAIAIDKAGDVYFTDGRIGYLSEIVASNGTISSTSTVQRIGYLGGSAAGLAIDGKGDIFVAVSGLPAVKEFVASNGVVSPGSTPTTINTSLTNPYGVAVDASGNLFVSDWGTNALYEIVATAGVVSSTSQVNTIHSFSAGPGYIAVDSYNNVFLAFQGVEEFLASNGSVSSGSTMLTLGSGLNTLSGVAVGSSGNIFTTASGAIYDIQSSAAQFAANYTSSTISLPFNFTSSTTLSNISVLTTGSTGKDYTLNSGGTTCALGTTYTAGQSCIVSVTFTPTVPGQRLGAVTLSTAAGPLASALLTGAGTAPEVTFTTVQSGTTPTYSPSATSIVGSAFQGPMGVAVDAAGNLFVADFYAGAVYEIQAGTGGAAAGTVTAGAPNVALATTFRGFVAPSAVAVDGGGDVFVAEYATHAIYEIQAGTGGAAPGTVNGSSSVISIATSFSGFSSPNGIAVDAYGNVYVADSGNGNNGHPEGVYEIVAGTGGALPGTVNANSTVISIGSGYISPSGIAVDASGNVYVADYNGSAVDEIEAGTNGAAPGTVNASSTLTKIASNFSFTWPSGIAIDPAGDLFVTDAYNNAVYEILAGAGGVSASSNVLTLSTTLHMPIQDALDAQGNLYFADSSGTHVREMTLATPPTLTFPTVTTRTTSAAQTVQVQNIGNTTLTFPIPSSGMNPSISPGFSYGNSSTCLQSGSGAASAFTLASGGTCTISLAFAPTAAGALSGDVVLTDNALNTAAPAYATQSIPLSGTSTLPATTTTLQLGASSVSAGGSLTLTANVKDGASNPVTYGTVYFYDDTHVPLGMANLNSSGVATTTIAVHAHPGTNTITATYVGDFQYSGSTSTPQSLGVTTNTSTVVLSAITSPVALGSSLTLTATVKDAGSNPVTYGTVYFYDNTHVPLGRANLNSSGVATTTITAHMHPGANSITATYVGDFRYSGATSAAQSVTIGKDTSTTTLQLGATSVANGGSLTLTATVKNSTSNPITYGTVFFYDNNNVPLGMANLNSSGVATTTVTVHAHAGANPITATYVGDYQYNGSTSTSQTLTVQ